MISKYMEVKIHNEVELCAVTDLEIKNKMERALLKKQISFYIFWEPTGFLGSLFSRRQERGIICVNDMRREDALECLHELEKEQGISIEFLEPRVSKRFF